MYVISLGCTHWSDFIADDMGINCADFVGSMMLPSHLDSCIFVIFSSRTTVAKNLGLNCVILDIYARVCDLILSFLSMSNKQNQIHVVAGRETRGEVEQFGGEARKSTQLIIPQANNQNGLIMNFRITPMYM